MKRFRYCVKLKLLLSAIILATIFTVCASQKAIVAGRLVSANEGNFHVAIVYDGHLICSGSLLRDNVVLTSASCVKDLKLSKLLVRAGSKTFKSGGQLRRISETNYHPQSQPNGHGYNIALMRLVRPFSTTTDNHEIGFVGLPTRDDLDVPSSVFIYGWGISSLKANGTISKQLRVTKYKVYSDIKCMPHLPSSDINDAGHVFCIGDRAKLFSRCNDDIGGPAVGQNSIQYGILSHTGLCSNENTSILTNIIPLLPWIRGVLLAWSITV